MKTLQKIPMTEKQLQEAVIELAQITGYLVYHTFDSRRSAPGFPDIVAVRPPRVLFIELKSEGRKTTPTQDAWLTSLQSCPGVEAHLWRPEHWSNLEIQQTLTRKEQ